MRIMTAIASLAISTQIASGDALSNHDLADEVATVIAGSEVCDIVLNEEAILAYIDDRVDDTDLGFSGSLDFNLRLARHTAEGWSGVVRSAQCRALENAARAHGFID